MNILLLVSTLGLGGAEKQLIAWADLLKNRLGAEVCVASFSATVKERLPSLQELDVPVVFAGREVSTLRRITRVVTFARRNRVDVVHAFTWRLSPIAVAAAKSCGAVPASSFQGDGTADLRQLGIWRRRLTLRTVKYYTSNSRDAMERVQGQLPADALIMYVPNLVLPPHTPLLDRRQAGDRHEPVVLTVSRLDDNKRLNVFLEALTRARREVPDLRGVIVGDGPARSELAEQASHLGLLPEGVSFLGPVLDPSESYASATMFAHLAASEGTPNVVLEAMAMGLPVVATRAGDLRNIIGHNRNGLLVPFDDASAAAQSFIALAQSSYLRTSLGDQGRSDMLTLFTEGKVSDALERFYTAVLSSKPGGTVRS